MLTSSSLQISAARGHQSQSVDESVNQSAAEHAQVRMVFFASLVSLIELKTRKYEQVVEYALHFALRKRESRVALML